MKLAVTLMNVATLLVFEPANSLQCHTRASTSRPKFSTTLWGRKVKKGGLSSLVGEGLLSKPKQIKKSTSTASKTKTKNKGKSGGGVSSDLAAWAASQQTSDQSDGPVDDQLETPDDVVQDASETFLPFKKEKKQSKRRIKQSERLQIDKKNDAIAKSIVQKLETALDENNNIQSILDVISTFFGEESTSIKTLTYSKQKLTYRLAWVGGDDALCHLGTGLHKVPLARMQEVFMNFQGKGRIEIFEVISVIGPFPNVRNTLQGDSQVTTNEKGSTKWTIVMDSMVDGTGKEILAGKEENIRRVPLMVYFSDQNAVVAVVPPPEGGVPENPLQDNGKNILVFVREDNIDDKLDALRVL